MSDLIKRLRSQEAVDGKPHEIEQLTDEAANALEAANDLIAELETQRDAFRTQATLNQHMVITCGVAASHPDPNLSRTGAYASAWNSEQANKVRALRDERDCLRARVAELDAHIAAASVGDSRAAFETALVELVNKIDIGLDSGDLLKDAARASSAIDAILVGGDLVANAYDHFRDDPARYTNSVDFRIGWDACLDAIGKARAAKAARGGAAQMSRVNELEHEIAAMKATAEKNDAKSVELGKMLANIVHDQTVAMQAALIEWKFGQGVDAGFSWISNTLAGPGHLPDFDAEYGKNAQLWFNNNCAEPNPKCFCGNPSHIVWMGQGFCCDQHFDEAKAKADVASAPSAGEFDRTRRDQEVEP